MRNAGDLDFAAVSHWPTMGILFETPTPTHTRQTYEQKYGPISCRICLVLKHFGSYFVQIFVQTFALYAGGGGHWRISDAMRPPASAPRCQKSLAM